MSEEKLRLPKLSELDPEVKERLPLLHLWTLEVWEKAQEERRKRRRRA